MLDRIATFRAGDGGFATDPDGDEGSAYGAFVALGAYQDLREPVPDSDALMAQLLTLVAADGGLNNFPGAPVGLTTATAAAAAALRQFGKPVPDTFAPWLLSQAHPQGGFRALPGSPIPDLLSTATAIHALVGLHADISPVKEACLDFIDSLWTNRGGFYGHWEDDILDCEYTYYGLLALGHLSSNRDQGRRHLGSPRAGSGAGAASLDWHASARAALLRARTEDGHWEGRLSTSALSTATAVIALATAARHDSGVVAHPSTARRHDSGVVAHVDLAALVARGAAWLAAHANTDGGWGDTPDSRSNISTTALAWGALNVAPADARHRRRGAEGRSVAHLRRRRRRRRLAAARARRPLRLGPHLLGADPHGAGDRRAPADPGATSRSCRSSWRRPRISCSPRCGCRW